MSVVGPFKLVFYEHRTVIQRIAREYVRRELLDLHFRAFGLKTDANSF